MPCDGANGQCIRGNEALDEELPDMQVMDKAQGFRRAQSVLDL